MKRILAPLGVLASLLWLAGCSDDGDKAGSGVAATQWKVTIAHAAPLTGPQAHLGKDNENGVRLAIDELNANPVMVQGKPVVFTLDSQDDQADPRVATTIAQRFVDEQAVAVIGHLNSGTTIPASRLYAEAGIPQISPSATNVKYTQQGFRTAFRVMANDAQQGRVLGQFAVQDMGATKIAIIDDRTAYGQGLADEFEKSVTAAGGTIVGREFTSDKATDFTAILTKIKGLQADLLFFGGMDAQGAPMIKQMKTLGVNMPLLGGDGINTAEFMALAGESAEGVTASLPGVPLATMPGGSAFAEKFSAKYGKIQLYAPYCYDAVMTLATAIKVADSVEPAKILPALASVKHDGVTAAISFDERGDLKGGAITLYRVEQGGWKPLKTIQ
jgi:branched-chain amino acid transport system substrate-binding protein